MNLKEHSQWLNAQTFDPGTVSEICQCGTEKLINSSKKPERMRAELLAYVFLDQFIYSHYFALHNNFKKEYPGPNLRQHSFGGHASPSWLLYSYHGDDFDVEWKIVKSTLNDYLEGGFQWLKEYGVYNECCYWRLAHDEIMMEFEVEHQLILLEALRG